jgi:hypothetical protein
MTLRLAQFRFAAVAFFAVIAAFAVVAWTAPSARAFTMENLSTGGNTTRFADPDGGVKNFGQGSQPFGPNGPTVQFGGGAGPGSGTYQGPYRSFGPRPYVSPQPPPLIGSGNN